MKMLHVALERVLRLDSQQDGLLVRIMPVVHMDNISKGWQPRINETACRCVPRRDFRCLMGRGGTRMKLVHPIGAQESN